LRACQFFTFLQLLIKPQLLRWGLTGQFSSSPTSLGINRDFSWPPSQIALSIRRRNRHDRLGASATKSRATNQRHRGAVSRASNRQKTTTAPRCLGIVNSQAARAAVSSGLTLNVQ